jgi:hypothetical protein
MYVNLQICVKQPKHIVVVVNPPNMWEVQQRGEECCQVQGNMAMHQTSKSHHQETLSNIALVVFAAGIQCWSMVVTAARLAEQLTSYPTRKARFQTKPAANSCQHCVDCGCWS